MQRRVAVIAPSGIPSTFAAKAATTTIPIVFVVAEDPVRLGLVASLARPGGNLTGINVLLTELAAKRLELLRELVPSAARVAVLVNPANATTTESTLRGVEPAARAMGLESQVLNASTKPSRKRRGGQRGRRGRELSHQASGPPCNQTCAAPMSAWTSARLVFARQAERRLLQPDEVGSCCGKLARGFEGSTPVGSGSVPPVKKRPPRASLR